jgi:hypothetical protein
MDNNTPHFDELEAISILERILKRNDLTEINELQFYQGDNIPKFASRGWINYKNLSVIGFLTEEKVIQAWEDIDCLEHYVDGYEVYLVKFKKHEAELLLLSLKAKNKGIVVKENYIEVDDKIVGPFQGQQSWIIAKTLFLSPLTYFTKKELYIISHPGQERSYETAEEDRKISPFHEKIKKTIDDINEKINQAGLSNRYQIIPNKDSYLLVILNTKKPNS